MTAFDYNIAAELVPTKNDSELSSGKRRRHRRYPVGYGRFARAAEAIRFAIEELPPEFLADACLEIGESLFDRSGIRRLYDSEDYPLVRRVDAR